MGFTSGVSSGRLTLYAFLISQTHPRLSQYPNICNFPPLIALIPICFLEPPLQLQTNLRPKAKTQTYHANFWSVWKWMNLVQEHTNFHFKLTQLSALVWNTKLKPSKAQHLHFQAVQANLRFSQDVVRPELKLGTVWLLGQYSRVMVKQNFKNFQNRGTYLFIGLSHILVFQLYLQFNANC